MMKRKWLIVAAVAGPLVLLLLAVKEARQGAGWLGANGTSAAGKLGRRNGESEAERVRRVHDENLRLTKQWYVKLTAERPELQIQYLDIPDERNGLVQLMRLLDEAHLLDGGPSANREIFARADEMAEMIRGGRPWDAALAAEALKGKEELLKRLEEIGLMPEQSCRGVDFERMWNSVANVGAVTDLMVAKARLASEAGDGEQARRTLQALEGVARHLSGTEAPTMLNVAIADGTRARLMGEASRAMDAAATPEEVAQWRASLPAGAMPDVAAILRADWNSAGPDILLPSLLGENTLGKSGKADPQPEVAAAVWADVYAQQVREASENDARNPLLEAQPKSSAGVQRLISGLAPGSREGIETVAEMMPRMMRGIALNRSRAGLLQAAVAVAAGEDPGVEPLTGQPYRVDREAGTVAMPEHEGFDGVDGLGARKIPGMKKDGSAAEPGK